MENEEKIKRVSTEIKALKFMLIGLAIVLAGLQWRIYLLTEEVAELIEIILRMRG